MAKAVSLNLVAAEWKSGILLGETETLGSLIHFGPDISVNGSSHISHFSSSSSSQCPGLDALFIFRAFVFIES